ncbi:hypothetical protein HS088_TW15G00485 [Tripterygium wilfordii]|uniref:DCD domain-containing protein n=1 Tax=Tripterygium wilfordii TaxID=458696 RepID=A0A7J7CM15_TRIWF|nr:DCD domain-containing protein NRP-B-like [Tripterygium wilfordii]KAF5734986.1 hypothetical protein HS088_TW15G00485 [Tripterygium wilfordii]
MENNQQSFYQFSDQLRLQSSSLANLSLNDSIWSNSHVSKRPDERRNFDIRVGGEISNNNGSFNNDNSLFTNSYYSSFTNSNNSSFTNSDNNSSFNNSTNSPFNNLKPKGSDFNANSYYSSFANSNNSSFTDSDNNSSFNNNTNSPFNNLKPKGSDFNGFNSDWKMGNNFGVNQINPIYPISPIGTQKGVGIGINGGFNKGIYSKPSNNYNFNVSSKSGKNKAEDDYGGKGVRKNNKKSEKDNNSENNKETKGDKRFKTLPPSESLPFNETIGGYIFVCNNDTMAENLKRQLFGLTSRYRDSVRAITPGLPLFLYNYSTHQLYGVFEAAGFGGSNIDPSAWEDKKFPGQSRFPAQVRVVTRKICEPLEEDSFRPILHHYDGPKFRLELSIPEALSLLDIFEETSS